jgi:hypothetical protein
VRQLLQKKELEMSEQWKKCQINGKAAMRRAVDLGAGWEAIQTQYLGLEGGETLTVQPKDAYEGDPRSTDLKDGSVKRLRAILKQGNV